MELRPLPGSSLLLRKVSLPMNRQLQGCLHLTGFNFPNALATFITYTAFCVDGNHITNLVSIGAKSPLTGPDPPPPATVAGFNTHNVFEGDTSLTRGEFCLQISFMILMLYSQADAFFGDNHSFNETLFDQVSFSVAGILFAFSFTL